MLTTAEVLATARAVAPDATIRNLTTQEQVELDQPLVKVPRTDADRRRHGPAVVTPFTTVDRPKVLVELDKKATVTLYLDPIDGSRWLADTVIGGHRSRTTVVAGAGSVAEAIAAARTAAGLPEPTKPPQPSALTFGGDAA